MYVVMHEHKGPSCNRRLKPLANGHVRCLPVIASVIGATHVNAGQFPFQANVNTLPSYMAALLSAANIVCVAFYFTEG